MRFSSPGQTWRRLTEKRSLWLRRDGKAQSGPRPQGTPHGKAHSARWASRKSALCWLGARRMRLSVTSNPRMRFSVECAFPHLGKRGVGSRKSAFCDRHRSERRSLELRLMEKRTLLAWGAADCAFPSRRRPGGVGRNPPPACGALWRVAQLGKRARATPRQPAGGVVPGPAGLGLGSGCTERRSLDRGPR